MHNGIFRNTRHTNPQADLRNSTDEVRFFISCRKDSRLPGIAANRLQGQQEIKMPTKVGRCLTKK